MKTANITKSYALTIIRKLTKTIIQTGYDIHVCDILIDKERLRLNGTQTSHERLWEFRYNRSKFIKLKRESEAELKYWQKLFSNLQNSSNN